MSGRGLVLLVGPPSLTSAWRGLLQGTALVLCRSVDEAEALPALRADGVLAGLGDRPESEVAALRRIAPGASLVAAVTEGTDVPLPVEAVADVADPDGAVTALRRELARRRRPAGATPRVGPARAPVASAAAVPAIAAELDRAVCRAVFAEGGSVEIATRCPAPARGASDGSWAEAVPLPEGRVGLAVGVCAPAPRWGPAAPEVVAATRVRSAVVALAPVCTGPSELVERLEAFADVADLAGGWSLAYVDLDPEARAVRHARVGRARLVVVPADGSRAPHVPAAGCVLEPGDRLVLCAGRPDADAPALDLVEAALSCGPRAPLDELADALVDALAAVSTHPVALLCASSTELPADLLHVRLSASPSQLSQLRERLRAFARAHSLPPVLASDLLLATGELAANAIEHAYASGRQGDVTVRVELADGDEQGILVRVSDRGSWRPDQAASDRGRGLAIARAIAHEIAIAAGSEGTSVTMRLGAADTIVR